MRGLTLTQPYASLIGAGLKRIETRSWGTKYRGPIAIHAAKGYPFDSVRACLNNGHIYRALCEMHVSPALAGKQLPRGAIIAVAEIVDCWRMAGNYAGGPKGSDRCLYLFDDSPKGFRQVDITDAEHSFGYYAFGRYAWMLENIRLLPEPIPCKGAQRLWSVPDDVLAQIEATRGGTNP